MVVVAAAVVAMMAMAVVVVDIWMEVKERWGAGLLPPALIVAL